MKVLSIRQPWALLVCLGIRTIENRTWDTVHRGEIAIHSGGYNNAVKHYKGLDTWDESLNELFSFGAIIGVAELYDIVPFRDRKWDDPCAEGPFCFLMRNTKLFQSPIPHKGHVNLIELQSEVALQVEEAKRNFIIAESNQLRERCIRSIPPGTIPKAFLRKEASW